MSKIFSGSDLTTDIINEVNNSGIVGISGGRLEVRAKLKDVEKLKDNSNIIAQSTYNHPATELAIIYNGNDYTAEEAKKEIISSYDKLNP